MESVRLGRGAEFDLIRRFLDERKHAGRADVRVGPGDDCAVVTGDGIALSIDLSVEGIHFRRDWLEPDEIGWRAAAAALSDLAAVAARPIGILASIAVREADAGDFAAGLMDGAARAVEDVGGVLLGGDLTRSTGPAVVDICVVGEARNPVLRSGAKPGDEVWVTGVLGGSALAVDRWLRDQTPPAQARKRFAHPLPRVAEARWLAERSIPTSMLDLSDGLAGDASHLAAASGVGILLEAAAIPIDPALLEAGLTPERALSLALSGGEDYELCFTARPGQVGESLLEFGDTFGLSLNRVGQVEVGEGVYWRNPDGQRERMIAGGFQHFGGGL